MFDRYLFFFMFDFFGLLCDGEEEDSVRHLTSAHIYTSGCTFLFHCFRSPGFILNPFVSFLFWFKFYSIMSGYRLV